MTKTGKALAALAAIRHRENSNSEPFLLEGIGERQADSEGGSGVVVPASGDSGLGLIFQTSLQLLRNDLSRIESESRRSGVPE
jgi:hypothetical protein